MKTKEKMYAIYIGYQSDGRGGGFDLFNVVDPRGLNQLDGSTVSVETIIKLGIKKVLDKRGNVWYSSNVGKEAGQCLRNTRSSKLW